VLSADACRHIAKYIELVGTEQTDGTYPSDHFALITHLSLK
jgi:hypothetical protein